MDTLFQKSPTQKRQDKELQDEADKRKFQKSKDRNVGFCINIAPAEKIDATETDRLSCRTSKFYQELHNSENSGDGDKTKSKDLHHCFNARYKTNKLDSSKSARFPAVNSRKSKMSEITTESRMLKEEKVRRCREYVERHFSENLKEVVSAPFKSVTQKRKEAFKDNSNGAKRMPIQSVEQYYKAKPRKRSRPTSKSKNFLEPCTYFSLEQRGPNSKNSLGPLGDVGFFHRLESKSDKHQKQRKRVKAKTRTNPPANIEFAPNLHHKPMRQNQNDNTLDDISDSVLIKDYTEYEYLWRSDSHVCEGDQIKNSKQLTVVQTLFDNKEFKLSSGESEPATQRLEHECFREVDNGEIDGDFRPTEFLQIGDQGQSIYNVLQTAQPQSPIVSETFFNSVNFNSHSEDHGSIGQNCVVHLLVEDEDQGNNYNKLADPQPANIVHTINPNYRELSRLMHELGTGSVVEKERRYDFNSPPSIENRDKATQYSGENVAKMCYPIASWRDRKNATTQTPLSLLTPKDKADRMQKLTKMQWSDIFETPWSMSATSLDVGPANQTNAVCKFASSSIFGYHHGGRSLSCCSSILLERKTGKGWPIQQKLCLLERRSTPHRL